MDREVKKKRQDTVTSGALAREARRRSREDMPVAFDFSHQGHALITLYVQFLCSDWSKFNRWVDAENLYSILKLVYFDS